MMRDEPQNGKRGIGGEAVFKRAVVFITTAIVCLAIGFFGVRLFVTVPETPEVTEAPAPAPSSAPEPVTTPELTEAAEPDTVAGYIKGIDADVVLAVLNRGDTVEYMGDVKGLYGYSIVKHGELFGLVERRFIRLDYEENCEEWTGYSCSGAILYEDIDLDVELEMLRFNTEVTVVDEFDECYFVRIGDKQGFVKTRAISRTANSAYSNGGDDGGDDTGADGGDIVLCCGGSFVAGAVPLAVTVDQEGICYGKATVRLDGTKLLAGLFEYGDEVRVLSIDGATARIYIYGTEATADSRCIRLETEEKYQPWEAFVGSEGWTYTGLDLLGKSKSRLMLNSTVEVLEVLGSMYLVRVNGELFYMTETGVSETKIPISYSGGGDSGDADGGNSGWTEPML